jgi:aldose 1-epimerase
MSAMTAPSGEQHVLVHGDQMAVIAEVGATLRSYDVGATPVCWGFAEDQICGGSRGQVLAPWPNRLRDGRYEFEGVAGLAALDEPERSNAIHGIVRWAPWRLVEKSTSAARLEYRIHPQPAYPYRLLLEIEYRLGDAGLAVLLQATAEGDRRTPFGVGFHPYLAVGPGRADATRVALPARTRIVLDERALPVGLQEIAGTPFDLVASPGPASHHGSLGSMRLDDCLTHLVVESDGRWYAELLREDQELPVVLWADAVFKYIMCFTGDTLAPDDRRLGVAVEPMTCPPDALRTGEDLIVLQPGATFVGNWGIAPAGLMTR